MGFFSFVIVFIFYSLVSNFIDDLIQKYYAKKCGYDCKTCKNWKCYSNWCQKQREKEPRP